MARGIMAGPPEVQNAHKKVGPGEPEAQVWLTNPKGAGIGFVAGEKTDVGGTFSQLGGFVGFVNPSSGKAYPKGDKAPSNPRGTKSVLTATGDTSKQSLLIVKNPNGAGLGIYGGGGASDTITLNTADGQAGLVITKKKVALWCQGTEFILWGPEAKITNTYALIKETGPGFGIMDVNTAVG